MAAANVKAIPIAVPSKDYDFGTFWTSRDGGLCPPAPETLKRRVRRQTCRECPEAVNGHI